MFYCVKKRGFYSMQYTKKTYLAYYFQNAMFTNQLDMIDFEHIYIFVNVIKIHRSRNIDLKANIICVAFCLALESEKNIEFQKKKQKKVPLYTLIKNAFVYFTLIHG